MKLFNKLLIVLLLIPAVNAMEPKKQKGTAAYLKKLQQDLEERAKIIQEFEEIYPDYQEHAHQRKYV